VRRWPGGGADDEEEASGSDSRVKILEPKCSKRIEAMKSISRAEVRSTLYTPLRLF
jgi:hypothetical protein